MKQVAKEGVRWYFEVFESLELHDRSWIIDEILKLFEEKEDSLMKEGLLELFGNQNNNYITENAKVLFKFCIHVSHKKFGKALEIK